MPKRRQLIAMSVPSLFWGIWGLLGLAFDPADASVYLGMILFAIVMELGAVVSYLHRILYGENGGST